MRYKSENELMKVHCARQFYENLFPSCTLYDVECPDHSFRKFTDDGQYLISFSRNHQDLIVYRPKWLSYSCKEEDCDLPSKAKKFDSFFTQLYCVSLASSNEVICKDFFLYVESCQFGLFATSTAQFHDTPAIGGAIQGVPSIERITFHLLRLEDGMILDEKVFRNDFVNLAHNMGVFLYDDLLAIVSLRYQTIHILQIRESGNLVDIRAIGTFCREDDELFLNSSTQCMAIADKSKMHQSSWSHVENSVHNTQPSSDNSFLSGIKQRLLSFIFRGIWNEERHNSMRVQGLKKKFYFHFQDYVDLIIWKVQFLDRHHLLIKFGSVDGGVSRSADHHPSFFAVYNMDTTEIVAFYQNSAEELYLLFEQFCDHFYATSRNSLYMNFISSHSNNIHAFEQLQSIRNKASSFSQFVKKMLASLPFSCQSLSPSPYFDQSLFRFDEKLISAADRHRPSTDHPIKFISRRQPCTLKFKIKPGAVDALSYSLILFLVTVSQKGTHGFYCTALHHQRVQGLKKKFYFHFQDYVDLIIWKVQFLDRHHLLIKFGSVDGGVSRSADHHPSFFAVYNMDTTEIVAFYQNSAEELYLLFEQFCDHFYATSRNSLYMNFISSHSNNIHAFEQLQSIRNKASSFSQFVKKMLASLPFSCQSLSPSPYFDQSLFRFDEKLISAADRHRPSTDHPIKFISRRQPCTLKFKIKPDLLIRLRWHHGGIFKGGRVNVISQVGLDKLSVIELSEYIKDLGYAAIKRVYYKNENGDFRKIWTDSIVLEITNGVKGGDTIDFYVSHVVDTTVCIEGEGNARVTVDNEGAGGLDANNEANVDVEGKLRKRVANLGEGSDVIVELRVVRDSVRQYKQRRSEANNEADLLEVPLGVAKSDVVFKGNGRFNGSSNERTRGNEGHLDSSDSNNRLDCEMPQWEQGMIFENVEQFRHAVRREDLKVQVGRTLCRRAKMKVLTRALGDYKALKQGMLDGCRRIIGLDGAFLKGAMVSIEDKVTWKWFINQLKEDLGIDTGEGWTFVSDMQMGLICAIKELLPEVEHKMCARHIWANWSKK
ncbi:hypothetical protein GH714_040550 [Hevea brasiliensis]|uniref:PB1-like domain-containing protein n=1 Tax=Hevea brasiliensis TaxID=3981 RepID=A0A6A6MQ06_HEVBR|nr:hypothetical protein GH714_040550 [Hevea brasiliensis]